MTRLSKCPILLTSNLFPLIKTRSLRIHVAADASGQLHVRTCMPNGYSHHNSSTGLIITLKEQNHPFVHSSEGVKVNRTC